MNFTTDIVPSLVLLRHIRGGCGGVVPEAAGTSLEAAGQGCRKPASHARYRVRHLAFRSGRGRRAVDNRRDEISGVQAFLYAASVMLVTRRLARASCLSGRTI